MARVRYFNEKKNGKIRIIFDIENWEMRVISFLTNSSNKFLSWKPNNPFWYLYIVENTVGVAWLKSIFFKVSGTGNVRESSSLGSFNNYVDQFWPPTPFPSRRQLWTFYIISTLFSLDQAWTFCWPPKGQLISKGNFLVFIWTKNRTKIFLYFCPSFLKWVKSWKGCKLLY